MENLQFMIQYNKTLPAFKAYSDILGYDPSDSLFFDIETTGFLTDTSAVFLIGAVFLKDNEWNLSQFLAETSDEECLILQAFLDLAQSFHTLIHFNGDTFDIPFLLNKAAKYDIPFEIAQYTSIDLYRKFRPLKRILQTDKMNQQSLEPLVGWKREDRLTGKHMVTLYHKYAVSKDTGLRDLLLLHNHDDMLGMTYLLKLSSYLPLLRGDISNISHVSESISEIKITFSLTHEVPSEFSITDTFHLDVSCHTGKLTIPYFEGTLYHFFPDWKNYYYLPLEDQAIHKSVSQYVDRQYREPAKACNCYIKKSGRFLPQPEKIFSPTFKDHYASKITYFEYGGQFQKDSATAYNFVHAVLAFLFP